MHNQNHWIYIIEAAPPKKREAKAAPIKRGKQHHTNEVRTGRQQRPKGERGESNTTKKEDWRTKLKFTEMQFISVKFKKCFSLYFNFFKKKKKKKKEKNKKSKGTTTQRRKEQHHPQRKRRRKAPQPLRSTGGRERSGGGSGTTHMFS